MKKIPNPIDKHVGARVRMRRMMLNMSQEKLADGLGLTFQQVQKYEKGTNRIGSSRLHQISSILTVPVSFFFEGAPGSEANASVPGKPDTSTAFFTLSHATELAEYFGTLSTSDRRLVTEMAQALSLRQPVQTKQKAA